MAVLVGMGAPEVQIPLINALIREVDIRGVFRYANEYVSTLSIRNLYSYKYPSLGSSSFLKNSCDTFKVRKKSDEII